jgi:hypothetical protein
MDTLLPEPAGYPEILAHSAILSNDWPEKREGVRPVLKNIKDSPDPSIFLGSYQAGEQLD